MKITKIYDLALIIGYLVEVILFFYSGYYFAREFYLLSFISMIFGVGISMVVGKLIELKGRAWKLSNSLRHLL